MNLKSRIARVASFVTFFASTFALAQTGYFHTEQYCQQPTTLQWDTTGGGDLHFEISRPDPSTFAITHIKYNFHSTAPDMTLTHEESAPLFDMLERIFYSQSKLTATQNPNRHTGTWTYITLIDYCDHADKMYRPEVRRQDGTLEPFYDLYNYVHNRVPPSQ